MLTKILAVAIFLFTYAAPAQVQSRAAFFGQFFSAGGGGSAWSPTNAYGWWKASSITAVDGAAVTQLPDSAGAHDFYRAGAHEVPIFTNAAINGYAAFICTNGTTNPQLLTNGFGVTNAQPWTFVFVVKWQPKNSSYLIDGIDTVNREMVRGNSSAPYNMQVNAGTSLSSAGTMWATNEWIVLTACFNGTASYVRTNGVLYAYGNAGANGLAGMTLLGRATYDNANGFYGEFAELVAYNAALATNDLQWTENSLGTKYLGRTFP